ncbi:MAG TPA: tetratricopeptide repeat protein [Candidatus Udaeobacter sp.]|nr:tetratricopeptide repeat protein [Candidatus Udaeobacter sp.]
MAKQKSRKKKTALVAAANRRSVVPLSDAPRLKRPDLLILLALTVMTFAIYAQVIGHQFISLDDPTYIQENPMVNRGVTGAGLVWAFTTFYATNWHPLTWISHMIDCQLFGTNAGGHLLVNALIHVANTLLVFWFLLRTTHARWPSALVAALFALHPLHVESVAWASERKDTLSTFFGLLSLIAYVRYAKAPSIRRYAWVAITLALGLLAKPMLVTWPFLMLLLDYWPLCRFQKSEVKGQPARRSLGAGGWSVVRGLVVEKIPLFALVAASAMITFAAQSHGGAVRTLAHAPIGFRLPNALVSYAKYLLLTFWPNDLAIYYPFAGIPVWQIIGAAFLLIGITVFCVSQPRKHSGYLMVGWLWFLGTLVPVIGIVQVGGQIMADRYFYIPSIGLLIALVFGLADIAKSWRVAPALSAGIAGGILLILATLTNAQIQRWRDSFTLFEHTLAVTPPNLRIEHNLGVALGASDRYDEAAAHFAKALQIDPNFYDGLVAMGVTRAHQGRLPEAIEYFQTAIQSQPDAPKARVQLAHALWTEKRDEAALEEMARASQLAPKDADIRADFGLALALVGRIPEAIEQLHEALGLNPNNAEAHNNLGLALLASGKARESIAEFEAAMHLKPELKGAADNLQRAQAQLDSQR